MGRFDLDYAWKYALMYNFGTDDLIHQPGVTSGRGGALLLLFSPNSLNLISTEKKMFGNGVTTVVTNKHGRFFRGRRLQY